MRGIRRVDQPVGLFLIAVMALLLGSVRGLATGHLVRLPRRLEEVKPVAPDAHIYITRHSWGDIRLLDTSGQGGGAVVLGDVVTDVPTRASLRAEGYRDTEALRRSYPADFH